MLVTDPPVADAVPCATVTNVGAIAVIPPWKVYDQPDIDASVLPVIVGWLVRTTCTVSPA